jgi:hypothetical protein
MSTAKEQFLRDKQLASDWNIIATGDAWSKVQIFARSSFMETAPSREEMIGANRMLTLLSDLGQNAYDSLPFPNPGLHHNLEPDKPKE